MLQSFLSVAAVTPIFGRAMEIQWTRMAGQWPVEASPLVAEFSGHGKTNILVLNRGGQLMLWALDGTAMGPGQDGLVAQLPQGRWTTAPMLVDPSRRSWHGDTLSHWFRKEKRWIVLNPRWDDGEDDRWSEVAEWIPTEEFTNRLMKTIQFLSENRRNYWTNAVKEHSEFLQSLRK